MQAEKTTRRNKRSQIAACGICCLTFFSNAVVLAQAPTNVERDTAEQRRAQERETQLREQQPQAPDVRLSSQSPLAQQRFPESETPCFAIQALELQGDAGGHFTWLLDSLAGPQGNDAPLHKCLGAKGISLVLQRAQEALVAKGYVTSRVLAQPQDLSSGKLILTVLPGRIRAIRFAEPVDPRATAWNAVPAKPGDFLNLRDIEQALENFKRVPTAEADIQITPGEQPGESDLLVVYQQRFPLRVSLSADDSGTKATGKYQGSATLSVDNFLGFNDLLYLTFNHDLGGGSTGPRGTQGSSTHYSLPYGYWMLGTTFGESRYYQTVAGNSQNYVYSGTSGFAEIKLARLVYRDAKRKTTTSLKAFERHSNNFIDDTEIQVQRRVVGGWEFGVNHKEFLGVATLEVNLAYKRGTGAFGSIPAPEDASGEGTSHLALLATDGSLNWPFKVARQPLRYLATWRVQNHHTALTPQDRFAIGGRYTVRGFDGESSLSAESGWLLRNELGATLGESGQELYVGLDHGEVSGPSSDLLVGKWLTGVVMGMRGSIKKLQYDFFVGRPINKPADFKTADFTAGMSLSLSL
ncbi:MAG: ShlB/FhaC/HecB family hemolysin secretion/activation protein [Gammaproteobacteria bacterium]|nr:ShlB/FhaC/HecB family hemolysin secretion/activation protein [Gammaproteobacteria bacterium]MBU0788063.1 ShlB/FhaC/HecB family hemolysin secretion/activation protein [Gammaproteobacteria bacterium]MBU0815439.1 ShlB/FhaC/HecB family hemolysin secretion/activation protein [Gammaproteobacteria bacterium]MBU1785453.1 ShlB/FhaC/HecB family hemolysin secretion/activation protein [Gammaproteobacteria bacterium]